MNAFALTRRRLLAGLAATTASAAVSAPVSAVAHYGESSVEATTPVQRFEAAVAELRAATLALHPEMSIWTVSEVDGCLFICAAKPPTPVTFSGYGAYEIQIGKTRPVVALARSENDEHYYRQLYWRDSQGRDRLTGKVILTSPADFTIIRKIRSL
jgi:hypothetical protein